MPALKFVQWEFIFLISVILFISCSSNNAGVKDLSVKDSLHRKPTIDYPDSDSSNIQNQDIFNFLKRTKKIVTDNRSEMKGIKLSFVVPENWVELKSTNPSVAYHFYNKALNTNLQVGLSQPSNDNDITESIKYKLEGMFPGFLYDRLIKIDNKNGLQMEHSRTIPINNTTSYVNTSTMVFFYKTHLIIFTYGSAKIGKEDTNQNILDFRLLYRHLGKTIKVLE